MKINDALGRAIQKAFDALSEQHQALLESEARNECLTVEEIMLRHLLKSKSDREQSESKNSLQ